MSKRKVETRYVCPYCGSDDIDMVTWVGVNDDKVGDYAGSGECACNSCEAEFDMWCTIDVHTGKCIDCQIDGDHNANFKPLERTTPPLNEAELINEARVLLAKVLDNLKRAGAVKSLQRVRLARSSVKGALANARYREGARARGETRKRIRRAPRVKIANAK